MNNPRKSRAIGLALFGQNFRVSVSIQQSGYGSPVPTLLVNAGRNAVPRAVCAAAHHFAALAELGTVAHERWVISAEIVSDSTAQVSVETMSGAEAEADRALAMLEGVLGAAVPTPPAA